MKPVRLLVAALAIAASLSMTACGGGEKAAPPANPPAPANK
jgi:hypothetical protein